MLSSSELCTPHQNSKEISQIHSLLIKSSTFSFNSLIRSYSTFLLNTCSKNPTFFPFAKQVHSLMAKSPSQFPSQSWNSLLNFYLKSGANPSQAISILRAINSPHLVSWNCLLHAYANSGDVDGALKVFDEMPWRDVVSWTSMLAGLAGGGLLDDARELFDRMPVRNIVSWSAVIGACVRGGACGEALALFREMELVGVAADKIVFTQVLSACAGCGAVEQGRWVHAQIVKRKIEIDSRLCASLVDMYAKCGRVDEAYNIFNGFEDKKVFLWNSMLGGLAMHSKGKEAMDMFYEMCGSGMKPNEITFICVLSACSHSGLVEDGLRSFNGMERDHGISPVIEHYVCVVDLLGRAGLIDDAKEFIEEMPMEANGDVWRAFLSACVLHGEVKLGAQVEKILLELEPFDDGNYVLLSNLYAKVGRWKDVARARRMMKEKGLRKIPGCSSIEIHGIVHEFVAGDQSHPLNVEIYEVLNELSNKIFERYESLSL